MKKDHNSLIGYLYNDHEVKPLHIMLPKTIAYIKSYDGQSKWMYFLIKDDHLLEKYNTVRDKVNADIKKGFDNEPIYNKFFWKNKIKSHGFEVTYFYGEKTPRWILMIAVNLRVLV